MPLKLYRYGTAFGRVWLALLLAARSEVLADAPAAFHVRHWTSENGLPANRVTAMAQTRDGYLWVGTWFGLARFDGVRFIIFNRANTPELPVEAISALAVDRGDGALWIGTHRGLARFKDGRFERLVETDETSGKAWEISELLSSERGGVWVRVAYKIRHWPSLWSGWTRLPFVHAESANAMWETADGSLVVMTSRRLFRVSRDGLMEELPPPPGFSTNELWTGAWPKDQQGRFWAGTRSRLHRLENGSWEAVHSFSARSFPSDRFIEDQSGAMWVAHSSVGLFRYRDDYQESFALGGRGAEKSVDCLLEDREGHVWAGTPQGLFQIRPALIRAISQEAGLPHRECWSVSEAPDGAVWVGTRGGLARLHEGQVTDALLDEPNRPRAPSILMDPEGWLWSGRKHNGVMRWLPGRETNWFLHRPGLNAASGVDLGALYFDRSDRVWIGTGHGAVWFENGQPAVQFGDQGLPTNGIRSIYQTRDGAMWFGTWKAGVVRWRSADFQSAVSQVSNLRSVETTVTPRTVERFADYEPATRATRQTGSLRYTKADGLADDRVFVFHEDADGALWIGTHEGLSRFKDGRFFTFRTEQGLFFNLINWMEEDDFGRFWFSCNRGIFHIDRAELNDVAEGRKSRAHAVVYGAADGMLSPETNGEHQPAGCKTRDGRIWFPTMDGVVVIDPRQVRTIEGRPVAVIEETLADGRAVTPGARLAPGRARDLQVRYTANSFLDPRRNRFQYRLAHHDTDWREETTDQLAVYTNLRPGDYRFELRAANAHGVWSETPAVFTFSLAPHFWQTRTFYALCGVAAFGLAAGVTGYRLRWQHRLLTARHAQSLSEERARIARDLHDDLGTALTGLALELDVIRREPGSETALTKRLGDAAKRTRNLAEQMREVVWTVNPRCDTACSLASFLEQQAEQFLSAEGIQVRLDFPENIPALPVDAEVRHQLALGLREALTNVVRHSGARQVTVSLSVTRQELIVSVTDDGRGFSASETETGNGLGNLRTRFEQVGGIFECMSAPGQGATLMFRLPLSEQEPAEKERT